MQSSLVSAETFEEAARAVAWAWEAAAAEEARAEGAVAWRWVAPSASSSRFAAALGGGYLEAHSRSRESAASPLLPGVSLPLHGGEGGGEGGEEEEEGGDEDGWDDEADAATLPRFGREQEGSQVRVELHVCFGASYRAPLMLVRGAAAAAASATAAGPSFCSLEALERSLAAAASAATGTGAPCAAGPLAPSEHPLLPRSGCWAALHACASAGAVAEMMMAATASCAPAAAAATEGRGEGKQGGRESGTQPSSSSSSDPSHSSSSSRAACALAAWMSLACPAVGVRPPLGLWRRRIAMQASMIFSSRCSASAAPRRAAPGAVAARAICRSATPIIIDPSSSSKKSLRSRLQPSRRASSRRNSPAPATALFKLFSQAPKKPARTLPTVVPAPSYRIPAVWLGLNAATALAHVSLVGDSLSSQVPGFLFASVLPLFLAVQASRVRFVFGPRSLEVVVGADTPEEIAAGQGTETENRFVGGKNEWSYDSFVNWEFFPSKGFPVLVYFKETQTKPEGQIHFFPVLFQAKELYGVMKERCGSSVNSG